MTALPDGAIYVLDANVFIQAARHYYAFDLAPRFWDSLIQNAESGRVRSIDRVKREIERGQDQLADWIDANFGDAFASTDEDDTIQAFAQIAAWVQAQGQFLPAAKADFAGKADGWLVAYARAKGFVVVTEEIPDPAVKRKVPIPNICQAFNVPFLNTFAMLRALGVRFV